MFSPDGTMLAYAFGVDGSDVFAVDPSKPGRRRRSPSGRCGVINTMPSFSPDARKIAFTSSRLNHAEVYICDVDGSNVELLTQGGFGDQFYRSNPAWSPDNRAIAFQSQIDGVFQVMLISPNGKNLQALTSDSENEDPFWAPDGRHLVFTSARAGSKQLWMLGYGRGPSSAPADARCERQESSLVVATLAAVRPGRRPRFDSHFDRRN